MSYMDWFWAGVWGYLGVIAAPFLIIACILTLIAAVVVLNAVWLWLVDFCKTAISFFMFCIGRWP
jgi:hypothetical protein